MDIEVTQTNYKSKLTALTVMTAVSVVVFLTAFVISATSANPLRLFLPSVTSPTFPLGYIVNLFPWLLLVLGIILLRHSKKFSSKKGKIVGWIAVICFIPKLMNILALIIVFSLIFTKH